MLNIAFANNGLPPFSFLKVLPSPLPPPPKQITVLGGKPPFVVYCSQLEFARLTCSDCEKTHLLCRDFLRRCAEIPRQHAAINYSQILAGKETSEEEESSVTSTNIIPPPPHFYTSACNGTLCIMHHEKMTASKRRATSWSSPRTVPDRLRAVLPPSLSQADKCVHRERAIESAHLL